jgi:serine/threonine protein kinase
MATVEVRCSNPECQAPYTADEIDLGTRIVCQRCHRAFVLSRWAAGRTLLGDFEVEGMLGEGGMGAVFLVRSKSGGQRFAVKTILANKLGEPASRRAFLDELQTWIDLPAHPHLVACRFFRTVGNEIAIFAEYVEGGSLADWIGQRKLTRLEQILDVAIQFAWGLQAAHDLGLVHQDVKPGNVLMTPDGVAKVSDFGLARARALAAEGGSRGAAPSVLVSWGGMTAAYCSPEQALGQPLSRKTDVWSWGLSVLEMFVGGVTWRSGAVAPETLKGYMGGTGSVVLPMPASVGSILEKCFREDPAQRWASMMDVAREVQKVYRQVTGHDYLRAIPAVPIPRWGATLDRRLAGAQSWGDPHKHLRLAYEADGRDTAGIKVPGRPRGSRKAQAIAAISMYEEARGILERLIAGGHRHLETDLVFLCQDSPFAHGCAEDIPGAIARFTQGIAIGERLLQKGVSGSHFSALIAKVSQEEATKWVQNLNSTWPCLLSEMYMNEANLLRDTGDAQTAKQLDGKAIALLEAMVLRDQKTEWSSVLAEAYIGNAMTMDELGDYRAALALYDKAIGIYKQMKSNDDEHESATGLARAYLNKAEPT